MKGQAGFKWLLLTALTLALIILLWPRGDDRLALASQTPSEESTESGANDRTLSSGVFTPAHRSMIEAARHFLGLRDTPEQPIAYSHELHVEEVGLGCEFCHNGVSVSAVAGIPSVETCMLCHIEVGHGLPEVDTLIGFHDDGVEPPWQRVYGWNEEAHVRFKHQPHYNAGVGCETCHGNVATMGVAERAVDHTMKFCVECHEQRQASIDCVVCHY